MKSNTFHKKHTLPLSTRLTARPMWDKTKNKDFIKKAPAFHMKSNTFHKKRTFFERPLARNCNPMFYLLELFLYIATDAILA